MTTAEAASAMAEAMPVMVVAAVAAVAGRWRHRATVEPTYCTALRLRKGPFVCASLRLPPSVCASNAHRLVDMQSFRPRNNKNKYSGPFLRKLAHPDCGWSLARHSAREVCLILPARRVDRRRFARAVPRMYLLFFNALRV